MNKYDPIKAPDDKPVGLFDMFDLGRWNPKILAVIAGIFMVLAILMTCADRAAANEIERATNKAMAKSLVETYAKNLNDNCPAATPHGIMEEAWAEGLVLVVRFTVPEKTIRAFAGRHKFAKTLRIEMNRATCNQDGIDRVFDMGLSYRCLVNDIKGKPVTVVRIDESTCPKMRSYKRLKEFQRKVREDQAKKKY